MLGHSDRVVQGQYRDGRRQPNVLRTSRDVSEHDIGRGEHAERVEMVLSDPGGMHSYFVSIKRLGSDVGYELICRT